jgi:uncharacterized membrane protein
MSDPTAPSSLPPESNPAPAAGAPPVPPQPAAGPAATSGLAPNIAAALASFFTLIGGIVFLVLEKKDKFVRFYAMQSVFLGGAWIALSIGLAIVFVMLHGIPLIGTLIWLASIVVRLAFLCVWAFAVYKAFNNKEWEIPYLGKLARQQLAKMESTTPEVPTAPTAS